MDEHWDSMAVVGTIVRPHGNRGQVIVNPETDFPDRRFRAGATLYARRGLDLLPLIVSSTRVHQGRPLVGFEGIGDISSAETLRGAELRIPAAELSPLPAGTFYRHDLAGCVVRTDAGHVVGTVSRVDGSAGQSWLVVDHAGDEILIPLVERVCVRIEPALRTITIDPPEGLLEVNAMSTRAAAEAPA